MNIEKVKRDRRDSIKLIQINIRISKAQSEWLSRNNLSPSKILQEAFRELGFKENN